MTREFNSQRRDDSRPSFRRTHPNEHGTARSSHPGRPRLNRETVDRAWESGAQYPHADYAPRDGRGPANRSNHYSRQQRQEPERNTFQRDRGRNSRAGNYREAPYNTNPNRRDGIEPRRYQRRDDWRDTNSFDERSLPHRRDQRDFRSSRDVNPPYREREQQGRRPNPGRKNYEERAPRRSDRFEAHTERPQRSNGRDARSNFNSDNRGSRFPERRPGKKGWNSQAQRYNGYPESDSAMFEGDYERFTASPQESVQRVHHTDPHKRTQSRQTSDMPEQRHVTHLPDGRVIKGSRPQQRKQAQFWTDVSEESAELLGNIHAQEAQQEQEQEQANGQLAAEEEKAHRLHPRAASAIVRKRKPSANRSSGPILRPSQRGFKWPTS